jgi:lipopolysaccharide biosynthesis glycosyltransferase
MTPIPIFVGYDPREAIAYHTCVNSIIRHASQPVAIVPVALNLFQDYEETHGDNSNHFVYTRFLVPHLMGYQGWAIFIDGDMVLRDDIVKLWNMQESHVDVMVVKHDYRTRMTEKYMGARNEDYPRKNWSSVILWNCSQVGPTASSHLPLFKVNLAVICTDFRGWTMNALENCP